MIITILTHSAAFILGALTFFSFFVYVAWKQQRTKPGTVNESRKMGENIVAVINPGNDALQRTYT